MNCPRCHFAKKRSVVCDACLAAEAASKNPAVRRYVAEYFRERPLPRKLVGEQAAILRDLPMDWRSNCTWLPRDERGRWLNAA